MRRNLLIAAMLLCLPGGASASELFGIDFPGATPLFSVNQSSGGLISIGATSFTDIADLTSDLQAETLWGVDPKTNRLLKIDPQSGVTSVAAHLDSPDPIVSIAFDPVTRKLYGNSAVGFGSTRGDALYAIDPTTGTTTLKGVIGFARVYALGFDQQGRLYGVSDFSKQLLSINPGTGVGTAVLTLSLNAVFDVAIRPEDDMMFLADSTTNSLYTLNTADGITESLGDYGATTNIVGLAFLMPGPKPGLYFLLGTGLAFLVKLRRRRPLSILLD
jgi:hypothetical protein